MNQTDWNTIAAISGSVIALCSLGLTIWQIIKSRRHDRLSVKPYLGTETTTASKQGLYHCRLSNNGLGPAHIKRFEYYLNGELMNESKGGLEKILKLIFPDLECEYQVGSIGAGQWLPPNSGINVVAIQFKGKSLPSKKTVMDAFDRVDLEIDYESIYGEKFRFPLEDK